MALKQKKLILFFLLLMNFFCLKVFSNDKCINLYPFYEKELDEIIQFNAWEVLSDFDNQQAANDDLSEDERMRLQNLGVNLAA